MHLQWAIPTKLTEPMIDFQKASFNNAFEAMEMLQNQAERLTLSLVCSMGFPEEGERMMDQWIKSLKQAREQYKGMITQGFDALEKFFPQREQEQMVKASRKKTAIKVKVKADAPATKAESANSTAAKKETPKAE